MEEIFLGFFVGNGVAVHALARCRIEIQASEAGKSNPQASCAATASMPTPNSRCGKAWYIFDDVFVDAGYFFQKAGITHARELRFFLSEVRPGK